jgi:hypothetical protein
MLTCSKGQQKVFLKVGFFATPGFFTRLLGDNYKQPKTGNNGHDPE